MSRIPVYNIKKKKIRGENDKDAKTNIKED